MYFCCFFVCSLSPNIPVINYACPHFLAESVKIFLRLHAGFPSADIFVVKTGIYVQNGFHENKGLFTLKLNN